MTPTLSPQEIEQITDYTSKCRQLEVLHKRGFVRAYRSRNGKIVLERPHFEAVSRGEYGKAAQEKPTVNLSFLKSA